MWYTEFRAHARDSDLPRQGRSWQFDLTFLTSKYRCIWGRGCPDTKLHGTARGCCVEGVEIYQGEGDAAGLEDVEMIRGRVEQMTSSRIACSLWNVMKEGLARGVAARRRSAP